MIAEVHEEQRQLDVEQGVILQRLSAGKREATVNQ
jgi:hypothetical protein